MNNSDTISVPPACNWNVANLTIHRIISGSADSRYSKSACW